MRWRSQAGLRRRPDERRRRTEHVDLARTGPPALVITASASIEPGRDVRRTRRTPKRPLHQCGPSSTAFHRRLQLPLGLTVAEPSGPILIHGSLIDASRTVEVAGNAIEDNFTLRIGTGTVSAVDYGAFVGEAHATDDAFLAGSRVVSRKPSVSGWTTCRP